MFLDGGSLKIRNAPDFLAEYYLPYKLTWHAPSEHTLGGLDNANTAYAYDIEMQIWHFKYDFENRRELDSSEHTPDLIVSIFFDSNEQDWPSEFIHDLNLYDPNEPADINLRRLTENMKSWDFFYY